MTARPARGKLISMSRHEPLPLDGEVVVSTSQPANLESQVMQVYWQQMRFESDALPSRSGQSARPRSALSDEVFHRKLPLRAWRTVDYSGHFDVSFQSVAGYFIRYWPSLRNVSRACSARQPKGRARNAERECNPNRRGNAQTRRGASRAICRRRANADQGPNGADLGQISSLGKSYAGRRARSYRAVRQHGKSAARGRDHRASEGNITGPSRQGRSTARYSTTPQQRRGYLSRAEISSVGGLH
jgi:hypothetical protein